MDPRTLLLSLSLAQYVASFEENAIDAATLSTLTDDDLKSLGVTALGHRKKILAEIAVSSAQASSEATPVVAPPVAAPVVLDHALTEAAPGARLPTLLALPLAEMVHEAAPVLALWAACDAVEIALKVCVMAGLAEYSTLPPELLRELRDRVEMPTLGKWLGMAQAVAKRAVKGSVLPLAATVRALEALLGGKDATVETGLLALRNRLAHGGPMSRGEAARLSSLWQPKVRAWAESSLGWLESASLVAVDAEGLRVALRGLEGHEVSESLSVPADAPAGSAWLCLGERALSLGPLGAYDPERRAMQVYVRRGEVRLQYLRLGDEGGICDSDASALELFRQLFFAPTPEDATHRFTIGEFTQEVRKEASRRVGREAELRTLVDAVRALETGTLWVGGPAGIGKSNLLAAAMEELVEQPPAGTLVLPYRFRAGDARCGRAPFLVYLRERLEVSDCLAPEASDGDEDGSVGGASESGEGPARPSKKSGGASGKESAKQANAMVDPLQEVRDLFARLLPQRRVLLVLDGLDEIAERDARFAEDVLLRLRADRVGIVGAGRPERNWPELFARIGAAEPFPKGLPPMSELDVRALLLERTSTARKGLLGRDKESAAGVRNAFIERVTKQSEGLPIYVNYVVGDLNAGKLNPEHADALPASLHAYHDELLRRAAIGDLQAVTTPVLVLLALALEPLTVEETAALLVRRGVLSSPDAALVERAVQQIGSMVRRAPDPDGEEGFTVFHHSLRTHVLGSPDVRETVAATRRALADAGLTPAGDVADAYLYRCGARHLLEAERVSEALGLLTDFDLVMARFQRLDATGRAADEWYADWDRVRARAGKLEGAARTWSDFARASRHLFRKKGWESWRVLFQAAMDHADDSAVTIAAEKYEGDGKRDWAWLRWVNREKVWQESQLVAVCRGHLKVRGLLALRGGNLMSWSGWGEPASTRIWNPATGREIMRLETGPSELISASELSDGSLLTVAATGAICWDPATGAVVRMTALADIRCQRRLRDGRLALGTSDSLVIWDPTGHRETASCSVLGGVGEVSLLQRNHLLVRPVQGQQGAPAVHDGETAALHLPLGDSRGCVHGIAELRDGTLATWPHGDAARPLVRLWDPLRPVFRAECCGHEGEIFEAADGEEGTLVTASRDRTRRVWDIGDGRCLRVLPGTHGPRRRVFRGVVSLNLSRLQGSEPSGRRLTGESEPEERSTERRPTTVEFSLSDGRVLRLSEEAWLVDGDPHRDTPATRVRLSRRPVLHGLAAVELQLALDDGGVVQGAAIALDGGDIDVVDISAVRSRGDAMETCPPSEGIVHVGGNRIVSWERARVAVWNAETMRRISSFDGHRHGVRGVVEVSTNVVASWSARAILCWDTSAAEVVARLDGHGEEVEGAAALPGNRLLSWSKDRTLRTWDLATGQGLVVYAEHRYHGITVRLLANGNALSWDADSGCHAVRYWNPSGGQTLGVLDGIESSVNGAEDDGDAVFVWNDKVFRRWGLVSQDECTLFEGHTHRVLGVRRISAHHVVSWSWDKSVRVWEVQTGREVSRMKASGPPIQDLEMLSDETAIARCSVSRFDGATVLHVWDLATATLRATVVPRAPSDLDQLHVLTGRPSATGPETLAMLALARPHGFSKAVYLPELRVAYSDGVQMRLVAMVARGAR